MGLLTILKKIKEEERQMRVLVLGLDNAGKTTIVKAWCGLLLPVKEEENDDNNNNGTSGRNALNTIEPTLGFQIYSLDVSISSTSATPASAPPESTIAATSSSYTVNLWDIGGQTSIRAYWKNYFERTDGIIWVVDASDPLRLPLVRKELEIVLQQERLAGATLLVLAHKSDVSGALSTSEIANALHLKKEENEEQDKEQQDRRHWSIIPTSAVTKQGLAESMDWLVHDISDRIFLLS